MSTVRRSVEIGILLYPGAQLAAVHGLTDLFAVATRLAVDHAGAALPALRVRHWLERDDGTVVCGHDTHPSEENRPVALIVPPSLGDLLDRAAAVRLAQWLKAQHGSGAALCSVCAGAFLLAETGLLSGRTATTHWSLAGTLAHRFPDIRVDADKLILDDGDIITAGGVMAWTDLGLKLVDRLLGPSIMLATENAFASVIKRNRTGISNALWFSGNKPRSRNA